MERRITSCLKLRKKRRSLCQKTALVAIANQLGREIGAIGNTS